jgi:hypothetical protein
MAPTAVATCAGVDTFAVRTRRRSSPALRVVLGALFFPADFFALLFRVPPFLVALLLAVVFAALEVRVVFLRAGIAVSRR